MYIFLLFKKKLSSTVLGRYRWNFYQFCTFCPQIWLVQRRARALVTALGPAPIREYHSACLVSCCVVSGAEWKWSGERICCCAISVFSCSSKQCCVILPVSINGFLKGMALLFFLAPWSLDWGFFYRQCEIENPEWISTRAVTEHLDRGRGIPVAPLHSYMVFQNTF